MKRRLKNALPALAAVGAFVAGAAISVGTGYAAHTTPIQLKNFDEVSAQMTGDQGRDLSDNIKPNMIVPVIVKNRQGLPYSPKTTCGTSGCHDYTKIADHAFHAALGQQEWVDNATGQLTKKVKPWVQGNAMYGKW